MLSPERQLELLQTSLDAAVLDRSAWRSVCDRLAGFLGGVGTVIVPEAMEDQTRAVVASASLDGLLETIFRDGWVERNYRRRAIPIIKKRGFATDFDIADEFTMQTEPFYADLLASQNLGVFIGLNLPAGGGSFIAAVERSSGAPAPDAELLKRAHLAQPLLMSSARASVALAAVKIESWKDFSAETSQALFLLDRHGLVVGRNEIADALLGSVLTMADRQLGLPNPRADAQFKRLVLAASLAEGPAILPRPVVVEAEGVGSFMLDAVRLPPSLRYFHMQASVIVTIRRIEERQGSLADMLRRYASLTEAEVKIALALFEGRSIADYAGRAGIAVGTARQQVKAVFRKTGTGRQAELAALMRRLAEHD